MTNRDASELLDELIQRHTANGYETEPRVPVSVLRDLRAALAHSDEKVGKLSRFLDISRKEGGRAVTAVDRAYCAMDGVTVFVTSRERIKQPEGDGWWAEEMAAARTVLDGGEL